MSANISAVLDLKEYVPWVMGRRERSGLDIIWFCLAVIITCTWTALHLIVPPEDYGLWKRTVGKIKWMLVMIIFPEYVFTHAVLEYKTALDDYIKLAAVKPSNWCVTPGWISRTLQRLLRRLSEFVGVMDPRPKAKGCLDSDEQAPHVCDEECSKWSLTHSYFVNMGGFVGSDSSIIYAGRLITKGGETLNERNDSTSRLVIEKYMSKDFVMDKSKADALIRLLWAFQVLRLAVDACIRASRKLPITQLEIITVLFSAISLLTWFVQLNKPQDIQKPLRGRGVGAGSRADTPRRQPRHFKKTPDITTMYSIVLWGTPNYHPEKLTHVPNDFVRDLFGHEKLIGVILCTASIIFGGIHVIAWNFAFPSEGERLAWHICSIIGTVGPFLLPGCIPMAFVFNPLIGYLSMKRKRKQTGSIEESLKASRCR